MMLFTIFKGVISTAPERDFKDLLTSDRHNKIQYKFNTLDEPGPACLMV
jgi:hypothetical protein